MRKIVRKVVVFNCKHLRVRRQEFEKRLAVFLFRRSIHGYRFEPCNLDFLHGYLRTGIEHAETLKFIAKELHTNGAFVAWTPYVKHSAANRKLSR